MGDTAKNFGDFLLFGKRKNLFDLHQSECSAGAFNAVWTLHQKHRRIKLEAEYGFVGSHTSKRVQCLSLAGFDHMSPTLPFWEDNFRTAILGPRHITITWLSGLCFKKMVRVVMNATHQGGEVNVCFLALIHAVRPKLAVL